MERDTYLDVQYKVTRNATIASMWLNKLPDLFAADFETAVKYTEEDLLTFKKELEASEDKKTSVTLQSKLDATALGHPSHCQITHLSVAWSSTQGFVIILDNKAVTNIVLRFLTTTTKKQIWHNLSYDMRFIRYFTGLDVKEYEDTQLLAKTLINHVDVFKARTGLKELAGHMYGSWGIAKDQFDLANMYDPAMLKYAAIDACATFWVWESIQSNLAVINEASLSLPDTPL